MSSRSKEEAAVGCNGPFPNAGQSTTLQQGFGKFYKCPKFSDITLVDAGRNRIAAHRLVLSAGSKRFDELLQQEKSKEVDEIECTDIDPSCLHSVLEYLYTSNCDIQIHNAVRLLAAALLYGCHDLENMANLFIHIHLNSSTCCFFFAEAQKHHVEHISIKCTCIASLDFNSVMRTPSFCNLTVEELMALLGSAKLGALPKLLLYKAGCAWMMQDVCRLGKFKDVLLCIQMGGQSPEELENFFNGSQGPEAHQLGYLEGHTVDSSSSTGLDLARAASAQSAIQCSRLNSFPTARSSNFEGRLNNVGSVTSNVKSDATTETHLESTEPSVTEAANTAINVALYTDAIGYTQKTNNSRCTTNSRNADLMTTSDSMPSERAETIQDRSPSSEITVIQKPRTQRTRGGSGNRKKGQPHTCQVEGCTNDLQGLKEYHNRYKICNYHLKVNSIIKDGQPQRFCQQCGRFHLLSEFDNKKRSCRARLLRHNERRRKRLKNGSKMTKPGTFITFPSSGISPQHLLYLPQMNPMKTSDAQTSNVESFLKNDKGVPARCVQFLPADMERCFMLSTIDSATDQSTSNAAKMDKANGVVKHNQDSDNIHGSTSNHHPDVKS